VVAGGVDGPPAALFYGSNVLARRPGPSLEGGEYSGPFGLSNFTNTGEIYNPVTNSWSDIRGRFPQGQFRAMNPTEVPAGWHDSWPDISPALRRTSTTPRPTNVLEYGRDESFRNDRSDEEGVGQAAGQ